MNDPDPRYHASSSALQGALREVGSIAQRERWSAEALHEAEAVLAAAARNATGGREIAQRFRRIAKAMGRNARAKTWQAIRRVSTPDMRSQLDALDRAER